MVIILRANQDLGNLTSFARDFCPFPNYNTNPLVMNMLSVNSSLHLRNHYAAVQSSLTPKQLEDFTQALRTTFGKDGKVTLGGMGVLAVSLAVLFDTLARHVRGEWVSESGPIPGLFIKDLRGYYPPQVYTISEYLRLVPHIANNPKRMKLETEKYHKKLIDEFNYLDNLDKNQNLPIKEDVTVMNLLLSSIFSKGLETHHRCIKNTTDDMLITPNRYPPRDITFSFNCDPEAANEELPAEARKYDKQSKDAFDKRISEGVIMLVIAKLEFANAMIELALATYDVDSIIARREDFDLKANALGKWPE